MNAHTCGRGEGGEMPAQWVTPDLNGSELRPRLVFMCMYLLSTYVCIYYVAGIVYFSFDREGEGERKSAKIMKIRVERPNKTKNKICHHSSHNILIM